MIDPIERLETLDAIRIPNFCPNCGADMKEVEQWHLQ